MKNTVSGVAGDGAFIKGNEPFKSKLKELIHPDIKFKWDILHLANRAYIDAKEEARKQSDQSIDHLMDYIQAESKKWRSGLDYTRMKMVALKTFKRPKLWSETRMVNFEYDQIMRFIECSIWWEVPNWVEILTRLYVMSTYSLKIMLSKIQSTKVKTEYVKRVFQKENSDGKVVMKLAVKLSEALLLKEGNNTSTNSIHIMRKTRSHSNVNSESSDDSAKKIEEIIESFPDVLSTSKKDTNIFTTEIRKWLRKNKDIYKLGHLSEPITRRESRTNIESLVTMLNFFIDKLWEGITARFIHSDLEANSCWSEAPAESIFSVYKLAITGRQSLTLSHITSLCRLITDGPNPGTVAAENLITKAAAKYQAYKGLNFQTKNWQMRFISKLISQLKDGAKVEEVEDDDDDDEDGEI